MPTARACPPDRSPSQGRAEREHDTFASPHPRVWMRSADRKDANGGCAAKVVVTGGASFIGANLARTLVVHPAGAGVGCHRRPLHRPPRQPEGHRRLHHRRLRPRPYLLDARLFNAFGPVAAGRTRLRRRAADLCPRCSDGVPLPVDDDGTQRRNLTFVEGATAVVADTVMRRFPRRFPDMRPTPFRTGLQRTVEWLALPGAVDHIPSGPTPK